MPESKDTDGTWLTTGEGFPKSLELGGARIQVTAGPDRGLEIDLSAVTRVGAGGGCDIRLGDPHVSRVHFEIVSQPDGYLLRDLDSRNGTRVFGHRVREIYLRSPTAISIGNTQLRFSLSDQKTTIPLSGETKLGDLVGVSVPMRALFARIEQLAPTPLSVVIIGETGTGKELVADALHQLSPRADGPFEVLDCGSMPSNLMESELFGYERGAFTGADLARPGIFERADGGTVFLDELGELPVDLQPKLLGALERRQVQRIGGAEPVSFDIRIIAATNRDLARDLNSGRFREDLYYRVAGVCLRVPPLRERIEDVSVLARHFVKQLGDSVELELSDEALESLRAHSFPGNVRELRNLIDRAALTADGSVLEDLARSEQPALSSDDERVVRVLVDDEVPFRVAKHRVVALLEQRYMSALIRRFRGNISKISRFAGLDRMTVYKMLGRTGLAESAVEIRNKPE